MWAKGETSGAIQELIRIEADCDRDSIRFVVHQLGSGFCHNNTRDCFSTTDKGMGGLMRTLASRKQNPVEGSYTNKLFNNHEFLRSKLLEEAEELIEAKTPEEVAWETADVIYFALVFFPLRPCNLLRLLLQNMMLHSKILKGTWIFVLFESQGDQD